MAEISSDRRFVSAQCERRRLQVSDQVGDRIGMAVAIGALLATLVAHHFGWA